MCRRVVDATYLSPSSPATTPPPFGVADGVRVMPVNQFVEIIQRQRDHAANNDQHDRAQLYAQLLTDIDNTS